MIEISDEAKTLLDEAAGVGRQKMLARIALERGDPLPVKVKKLTANEERYKLAREKVASYGRDRGGHSKHSLYSVWSNMIQRCYNPNIPKFRYYGGRGVSVCDEWFSFLVFFEWAEPLWKKGLKLDKDIIKIGNTVYCPEFCHFVTSKENNQPQNKTPLYVGSKWGHLAPWRGENSYPQCNED